MTRPPAIAILMLTLGVGCDRADIENAAGKAPSRTPRETVQRLIDLRAQASYRSLEDLILAERADEVVRTLTAIDGFLAANRALCDYVSREHSAELAQGIDQSRIGASLDIFSTGVSLVGETIDGVRAEVAYTVNDRVPLKRAALVRVGSEWRYDPGPGYDPSLPAAFDRMADGLRLVLGDLQSGRLTRESVAADPDKLADEIRVRLTPGIKMLKRPAE